MQNGIKLQEQDIYYLLETVLVIDCTQYLHTRQPPKADHEEKITDLGKGTRSVFSFFSSPLLAWGLILSLDLILRHPVMKHNQRVIRLPRSQTAALITISVIHSAVITYLLHCWPAYLRLAGVTTLALVGSATRRIKMVFGFFTVAYEFILTPMISSESLTESRNRPTKTLNGEYCRIDRSNFGGKIPGVSAFTNTPASPRTIQACCSKRLRSS